MTHDAHPVRIETLLREHSWVRRLALRLVHDEHAADDVVQQTWLAALRSPPERQDSLTGWLATVVRNAARTRQRTAIRREAHERRAQFAADAPATDEVVTRAETQQRVGAAVASLDEPYRTTVLLRFYDDLPPREVARRMGVPVETVRTRTRRGLAALRARLDGEHGGDGRSWVLALMPLIRGAPPGLPGRRAPWRITAGALLMALTTSQKLTVAAAMLVALLGGLAAWQPVDLPAEDRSPPADSDLASVPDSDEVDVARRPGGRRRAPDGGRSEEHSPAAHPESPTAATAVRIRVLQDDGSPLSGASVVVIDENPVASPRTGADGYTSVLPADRDRTFLVAADGIPTHLDRLAAGVTTHEVTVPAGLTVAGVVRVDGVPAGEGMVLSLVLPAPPAWTAEIPRRVWAAVATTGHGPRSVRTVTGPGGRFAFAGLPAARLVWLDVPWGLVDASTNDERVAVELPADGLVVDLLRLPRVTGRVVTHDGLPVAAARVTVEYEGDFMGMEFIEGEDDGTFELLLPAVELKRLDFEVSDAEGLTSLKVDLLDGAPLGRDLGVLELPPARVVRLLIVDDGGRPVAGALATYDHEVLDPREVKSGPDGGLDVPDAGTPRKLRIRARGHQVRTVTIDPGRAETLRVDLRRSAVLEVELVRPATMPGEVLNVHVAADGDLLDVPDERDDHAYEEFGPERADRASSGAGTTDVWFQALAGATAVVDGIAPGKRFRVRVADALGLVFAEREFRLDVGERKRLRLVSPGAGRTVRGSVRTAGGAPVAKALVKITAADAPVSDSGYVPGVTVWTDDAGQFAVPGVRTDRVCVVARAEGFVPWSRRNHRLAASDEKIEIALERGRTAEVRLVDAAHQPVRNAIIRAEVAGALLWRGGLSFWSAGEGAPGVYSIADLPEGAVEFRVTTADGETHTFADAAGAPVVRRTLR